MNISDLFYCFLLGGGQGEIRGARKGGIGFFFIENARRRVSHHSGAGCLQGGGGWGTVFFFMGPKFPQRIDEFTMDRGPGIGLINRFVWGRESPANCEFFGGEGQT